LEKEQKEKIMKKPKRPKPKLRPAQPQSANQTQLKMLSPWQALQTWWGKLVAGLALIGAFQSSLSTFDFFRSLYQDTLPDIRVAGDDRTPFALPLIVKNKSHLFAMTDIRWTCGVENAKSASGGGVSGIGFQWVNTPRKIEADGTETFPCNVFGGPALSAAIIPSLEYKTLWFVRSFSRTKFVWYGSSDPPRWVASDAQ
jgi:hypothetical protein